MKWFLFLLKNCLPITFKDVLKGVTCLWIGVNPLREGVRGFLDDFGGLQ